MATFIAVEDTLEENRTWCQSRKIQLIQFVFVFINEYDFRFRPIRKGKFSHCSLHTTLHLVGYSYYQVGIFSILTS